MNIKNIKNMFGDEIQDTFEVKYDGPSFEDNFYDIDLLSNQLGSLDKLIKQSLKENKLGDMKVKRKVQIKKGSLIETVQLLTEDPIFITTVGSIIGGTISGFLVHYLGNKNETNKKLDNYENMVSLIRNHGDSLNVNVRGGNNNFYLNYDDKSRYLKNLEPVQEKLEKPKRETLVGKFRMVDLNKQTNQLGFNTRGKKNILTTIKNNDNLISILSDIMDRQIQVDANVTYKNGEISSVEVLKYGPTNKEFDFNDNSV